MFSFAGTTLGMGAQVKRIKLRVELPSITSPLFVGGNSIVGGAVAFAALALRKPQNNLNNARGVCCFGATLAILNPRRSSLAAHTLCMQPLVMWCG
jgi:hypothetical protein